MISKDFLKQLQKLDLPSSQYAIYGSGVLAIRDIRKNRDLDIVVTDSLYKKLREKYPEVKEGNIKISDEIEVWSGKESRIDNPEQVIARAETIKGLKYITLDDLIVWKKKMSRPKDLKDIKLIMNYLGTHKNET